MVTEAKDYVILSNYREDVLTKMVTEHLEAGWKLYGPMTVVAPAADCVEYLQVLIKTE